jgi:hypothetical protein
MKGFKGIIYKITNKINGKCYIGQTTRRLSERRKYINGILDVAKGKYKQHKDYKCKRLNQLIIRRQDNG